jgi:hypothetical protein
MLFFHQQIQLVQAILLQVLWLFILDKSHFAAKTQKANILLTKWLQMVG